MEPQQPNPQQLPPEQSQNQTPGAAGMGQVISPTAAPQQTFAQPTYEAGPSPAVQPTQPAQPIYGADMGQPVSGKSSKTPLIILVAVIILAACAVGAALVLNHGKKNNATTNTAGTTNTATGTTGNGSSFTAASVKACDAFTLAEAQTVLGGSAQASSLNGAADTSTADQALSSCGYQVVSGSNVTTANVSLTGSLTQKGLSLTTASFSALKSKDAGTAVSGIGDQAFYDSKTNALVALKGNYMLVVTYLAENNGATSYGQAQTEQIAKAVVSKL